MLFISFLVVLCVLLQINLAGSFQHKSSSYLKVNRISKIFATSVQDSSSPSITEPLSGRTLTKEIMTFFTGIRKPENDVKFRTRLAEMEVDTYLDGMHILTILFQCARSKRFAKSLIPPQIMMEKLSTWTNVWSERDISTFVYGIKALEGFDTYDGKLIALGASKIKESSATLSSRSIGNALYGLQGITSATDGVPELCESLADKIALFEGDLSGQDIGIGIYGLQGLSADRPQVRKLIGVLADKIAASESELDAQALSNALYGLQSMSSDYAEVLKLVNALATKVSESSPLLSAQAIGAALYGLQQLSSDKLEVRTLVAVLAEKVSTSAEALDAQAIGNALFGLQNMKSTSAEVRALVQALADKLAKEVNLELDSKAIGSALYGLHCMSSDVPQVRYLLNTLAVKIDKSKVFLSGQTIAEALYGLSAMKTDCEELRNLLAALTNKIDSKQGKLDSQEIGNAIFGFQGLSSEMAEVRQLAVKIAEKLRRSTAILRSQHIARAMLGLQRLSADTLEVRYLLKQLTKRIEASDRTRMSAEDLADALFGLQGMASNVPEVQELVSELAKKVATTSANLTPTQLGKALFGLQGLSSAASIFQDSAIGLDSDEVAFLLSAIGDKIKAMTDTRIPLSSVAMGLQGLTFLKDPLSVNIKQLLYSQLVKFEDSTYLNECERAKQASSSSGTSSGKSASPPADGAVVIDPVDVVNAYRSLKLNQYKVPAWLETRYSELESSHATQPVLPFNRQEKLVSQKYSMTHSDETIISNGLLDGFRMDFYFPALKLNIELDGPSHRYPARARFDTQRDEYLRVKQGVEVARLYMADKTVDQLAKEVRALVESRKEKVADIEIQKLYMKVRNCFYFSSLTFLFLTTLYLSIQDDAIQKLYTKK